MVRAKQTKTPAIQKAAVSDAVLIIDREPTARKKTHACLTRAGFEVEMVATQQAAIDVLAQTTFRVVLADCTPGDIDGLALLNGIKRRSPDAEVILVNASPDVDEAVAAIQNGAADYLAKPVDTAKLAARIAMVKTEAPTGSETILPQAPGRESARSFVTRNPEMLQLLAAVERVAGTKATILITGESGTGKEVLARYIHRAGGRTERPFIAVNCAALPETLIESELFGHEKGAFTGAAQRRTGKFEQVGEGMIVLDEIGDMPLALQPKILRVLQERRIERLGGAGDRPFEGQVIAVTHQDLEAAVRSGNFREDLYYRINVVPFDLPPLRARRGDIPLLARHFIAKYETLYQKRFEAVEDAILAKMAAEAWPGNVRELENRIERAVLLSSGPRLTEELLAGGQRLDPPAEDVDVIRAGLSVRGMEKILICKTMQAVNQNRAKASELLGISVRTLRNKLNEYKAGQNEARTEALS